VSGSSNQIEKRVKFFNADIHKKNLDTTIELEEGEVSPVLKGKSDRNDDPLNQAKHIAIGNPLHLELTLNNSFELLEVGEDIEEARKVDGKLPLINEDDLSSDNEVVVSIEKASFLHITNSEALGKWKSGPS